ncbi:MAG: ABC transporter permease [Candidatus Saccharibacteria bacterium]|nr:ABC transporter permease [Rhodoferax sp.]
MTFKDLRVSWRQIVAEPAYSLVVIVGLAIAIAAAYLIALLLQNRWLPDPAVPAPDRVVRVEFKGNIPGRDDDWFDAAPFPLRDALLENKAPVVKAARTTGGEATLRTGDRWSRNTILFADADIVPIFGLKPLQGDLMAALTKRDNIALTRQTAERLFSGGTEVMGQRIRLSGRDFTVAAILPNAAANSELQYDAIVSFSSPASGMGGILGHWYMVGGRVYARMAEGATTAQLSGLLQDIFDRSPGTREMPSDLSANGRKAAFVRAVGLTRIPFEGAGQQTRLMLYSALSVVAAAMLGLAAINYVNLSSVRTLRRQREIAIRKSLGASPLRLAAQFIAESSLVAVLAGMVALLLAWLLAPAMADLLEVQFAARIFAPTQLVALFLGCLLLGALTGTYPTRVALGVHCAPALQGRKQSEGTGGRRLRRAMTVLQFGVALVLSGVAVVVVWQSHYVTGLDMGFKTTNLLALNMPDNATPEQLRGIQDSLRANSAVQAVSASDTIPGTNPIGLVAGYSNGQTRVTMRLSAVDVDFFDVYQVPLLAGDLKSSRPAELARDPNAIDRPVILDATAAMSLGFANPQAAVGASLYGERGSVRVVAVVGAIKQESARNIQQPQMFHLKGPPPSVLTVRGNNLGALRAAANEAWSRYLPDEIANIDDVTELLAKRYREERNTGSLIVATSLIALMLAGFGVYALAAYTVRRAALEIVMRKLHGAGHRHIAALLVKEFAPLLGLATLISLPLVWWLGQQYLAGFVERAPMGGWPMLAALVGTLLTTGLAGLRHGVAAMTMRPILALRD